MFKRKERTRDSDRKSQEDSRYPRTGPGSAPSTLALYEAIQASGFSLNYSGPPAEGAKGSSKPLIDTVASEIPILAKREAGLRLGGRTETPFMTVTKKGMFGVLTQAICRSGGVYGAFGRDGHSRHDPVDVPNVKCNCGFYAIPMDASDSVYAAPDRVTLLVELSGRVIEHEKGFRAEWQRVVECQVPPCPYCGKCSDRLLVDNDMVSVRFVCDAHVAQPSYPGAVYLDFASLAHRIGVPVTRLELP